MRRRVAVFLLLPLQLALSGAAPSPSSIGELERGKEVYLGICADCHGKNGRGDGPKSIRLGFHPRDFSRASFKCRCTASGELPTDEDLIRTVTVGLAGTPMAGRSGELSANEIRAVVSYLKTFSPQFASDPAPRCLPIPEPPASAPEQLTEGKQVYRLLGCWQCHGNSGRGDGPASAKLEDDWGERARPHDLTRATGLKCGRTDRDLYRTLHTGLTGRSSAEPLDSPAAALEPSRETESSGRRVA